MEKAENLFEIVDQCFLVRWLHFVFFGKGDVFGVMFRNRLIDMEVEPTDEATDVSSY